jgi:hypothetical protein
MRRLARLALGAYPRAYRRRYGEEMRGLIDDRRVSAGDILDLARGAAVAHLRPSSETPGDLSTPDRLRLSAGGVFACWVAFAAAGLAFYKTTDGATFTAAADAHPALSGAYLAIQILAALASAAVVVAAIPLIFAALAERGPARAVVLRSLAWAVGAILAFAGATAVLVALAHKMDSWSAGAALAVLAAWGLGGLVCGGVCVAMAKRGLFAASVPLGALRFAVSLGILAAAAMWAIAVATAVYLAALSGLGLSAAGNGPAGLISVGLSIFLALLAMLGAGALATVSSLRGLKALRSPAAA